MVPNERQANDPLELKPVRWKPRAAMIPPVPFSIAYRSPPLAGRTIGLPNVHRVPATAASVKSKRDSIAAAIITVLGSGVGGGAVTEAR